MGNKRSTNHLPFTTKQITKSTLFSIFAFQFADILIMIKSKVFRVLFFVFLVAGTPFISWGSTITKEYCQKLIDSAKETYSKKNYAKSIEILLKTKDFAEANSWVEIEISTLNWLGIVYHSVSDYDKAMDYYMEAYQLVLNKPDMKIFEAKILNNIAGLYLVDKKYDMATDYYQKALLICRHIKDTAVIMAIFNNLGIIANELNNMDLAIQYTNSSLKLSQGIPTYRMVNAQAIKAQALYQKQEYNVAEKLALEAFRLIQVYEISYQQMVSLILLITKIYQAQYKEAEALLFIRKYLDYHPNLQEIIEVYEQMAILYQKNKLPDLALAYKDSVIVLKDSLHKINAFKDTENSYIRLELLNSERELSENKAKQKAERMLFIVVIISIFILAMIFIWVLRIQSIRNRQRKQITELELLQEKNQNLLQQEQLNNEKLRLKQQLKEQETIALLEQERLQNEVNEKLLLKQQLKEQEMVRLLEQERLSSEIETKNKQLLVKALSQSDRNELLKEVIVLLSDISQKSDNPQLGLTMRKLKTQLKQSTDWDDFLSQFERINPYFLYSLKEEFPTLTTNDIHLLSYIYLNLDTQKISDLLNISVETCRKKKHRLAGKMKIKTTELHVFLVNKIKFHTPK